jgi:hypothetical protein
MPLFDSEGIIVAKTTLALEKATSIRDARTSERDTAGDELATRLAADDGTPEHLAAIRELRHKIEDLNAAVEASGRRVEEAQTAENGRLHGRED